MVRIVVLALYLAGCLVPVMPLVFSDGTVTAEEAFSLDDLEDEPEIPAGADIEKVDMTLNRSLTALLPFLFAVLLLMISAGFATRTGSGTRKEQT